MAVLESPKRDALSEESARSPEAASNALDLQTKENEEAAIPEESCPCQVKWDGPGDPAIPQNWSLKRRWMGTLAVSAFSLVASVSSSIIAPCLPAIASDLKISNDVVSQLCLSSFVLAWAIGPLFLGPLSEMYGRISILQASNVVYLIFNIACGFSRSSTELIIFRLISGLGASAPTAICDGVVADLWHEDVRGKSISIYSLAPLLGPAIGPIAGGFISEKVTWRWAFYATSIVDAAVAIVGIFVLRETYAPVLLKRKAEKERKKLGNTEFHTQCGGPEPSLLGRLQFTFMRSFKLIGTQVIIQTLGLYMAFLFGLVYLLLSTFAVLFTDVYHESVAIGGLNYIAIGIGLMLGTQIGARYNDRIFKRLKLRNNNKGTPEHRLPLLFPSSILVPVGLLIYGWSADRHIHWIVPDTGVATFTAAIIVAFQCIQMYIIDCYGSRYAASAMSAASLLRSLAGFGFPLFAPQLYQSLGYGWGNSLLAAIAVMIGWPACLGLWTFGKTMRARSRFCVTDEK